MRFLVRKRRSAPAVIIVALIDVLIVLVIFLMVTTTFKQQPALKLALPESSQAQKSGTGSDDTLVLAVYSGTNNLPRIFGKGFMDMGTPVSWNSLGAQLKSCAARQPGMKLTVRADKDAPFGQIVKVMDYVHEAKMASSFSIKDAAKP